MTLCYLWQYSKNDNPYVRIRNDNGDEVSVMYFNRVTHGFFRVFLNHRTRMTRGTQPIEDFGNLKAAWLFARKALS